MPTARLLLRRPPVAPLSLGRPPVARLSLRRALLAVAALLGAGLLAAPSARAGGAGGWRWPVRGPILTDFRYGPDSFARGQRRGLRIGADVGTPVRSACGGRVRFAGPAGTSGRTVSVACGRLLATYLHLGAIAVRRGASVRPGERLGTVGRSGRPRLRAPHLAFGVRLLARRWAYVDPLSLLPAGEGSRPPRLVPAVRRRRPPFPRLGPAPSRAREPVKVPHTEPQSAPRSAPLGARRPAPVGAPRAAPLGASPAAGPGDDPASFPLVAWLGLAALVGALVAVPAGRGRRRRGASPPRLDSHLHAAGVNPAAGSGLRSTAARRRGRAGAVG